MEYRKSVLVIVAEDVKATIDLGKIEESFDVIAVSGMDEAREYLNKGHKKTDAILMYVMVN